MYVQQDGLQTVLNMAGYQKRLLPVKLDALKTQINKNRRLIKNKLMNLCRVSLMFLLLLDGQYFYN